MIEDGAEAKMDIQLPEKKSISGRVVDFSFAPLPGADVIALRYLMLPGAGAEDLEIIHACAAGLSRTTSGPDGRYQLEDLPAGALKVVARLPGFELAIVEDVEPGAVGVDFVLVPLASLQLRVANEETGAPVSAYRVDLRYLGSGGRGELVHPWNRRGLGRREVQSADGRVTVPWVPSGRHELRLEAEGFMARSESLSLLPGERRELTVVLSRGHVIRGRVWGAAVAAPLRGATISLRTAERSTMMTGNALSPSGARTTTSADGAFGLRGVPEGLVVLTARHSSHLPWSKEIQVAEDTVIDDIELQAAALLSLELKGIESTSAQVVLEPLETGSDRRTYSLVPLAGDRYLGTSLPGGAYMLLVRRGGEEFRRGPIALHEGREEKVSVTLGVEKH